MQTTKTGTDKCKAGLYATLIIKIIYKGDDNLSYLDKDDQPCIYCENISMIFMEDSMHPSCIAGRCWMCQTASGCDCEDFEQVSTEEQQRRLLYGFEAEDI